MRNDYTDYIQHAFGHKYVAKVKTASGTKYFYTQEEYDAYRNGDMKVVKRAGLLPNDKNRPLLTTTKNTYITSKMGPATSYKNIETTTQGKLAKTANSLRSGTIAGIHQKPSRGLDGAAYSVKKKATNAVNKVRGTIGSATKRAAATVGSTPVTSKKNGPQAPASVYGKHKANNAKNAVKNAAISVRDKTIGAPDSNSNYRVAMRKIKNTAGKVGKEFNKTFGHNEKHNNMNRVEKAVMNAQNKISTLEYKVSKKIDSLIGKNKKVSPELAAKMKGSVDEARREIVNSGADSETIKMMNNKLDKILKEIEANKTVKNTGSHPAYNQGVVSYKDYKPAQGSRPTNNQGYVPKTSALISNPSSLPQRMREAAYLDRKARNEQNMTASQKDLQKQFNNLMTVLDRNKKKKKK